MAEVIIAAREIIPWREAEIQVLRRLGRSLPLAQELESYQYLTEHPLIPGEGIHGQRHVARVLAISRILGDLTGADYDREAVDLFAVEHDRQRRNDGRDLWHGARAAKDMQTRLKEAVKPDTLKKAARLCYWHVFPEWLVPDELKRTWEWKIAADADALDRTRNGQPHDWGDLDQRYLRLKQSFILIDIARELAARSNIETGNPFTTVISAAKAMGLLQ